MSDLLTSEERAFASGQLVSLFDTFKVGRDITIFKSPIKVFTAENAEYLPGYGSAGQDSNFTYQPVSGVYEANVFYNKETADSQIPAVKIGLPEGQVRIKVKQDARNYLENGKTESIIVDGQTFNNVSQEKIQNYCGAVFYYYLLKKTN